MAGLDVGAHFLQDEGDDGGLHGQEEDIAALHRVLVAHREVHAHFLQRSGRNRGRCQPGAARRGERRRPPSLTRSPLTVGRSVSGELAVILCAARTPANGTARQPQRLGAAIPAPPPRPRAAPRAHLPP